MNYTVITKSGWQGDFWRVRKTFGRRSEAASFAGEIKTADPAQDGYNIQIKAHRKPLAQLMSPAHGSSVKFSDGTVATWDD